MTERRKSLVLPKPEDILDALVDEYVATMQAQGFDIGDPTTPQGRAERVAMRRAANIQYAWHVAFRAVLG